MKSLVVLALVLSPLISGFEYVTKYIEVPVDHFSFSNNATFKMKYLINDTNWVDDGPIFFYTGNEGTIENFAANTGFMFEIAPQFNALLVFAEHRYYGTSLPFGNLSFTSPNYVGYLTSNQALADYVFLIDYLQGIYDKGLGKVPVVAFGGSYGGMLSAWMRMKYPASIVGSIAASAPIWQFQDITPCENFNIIVTDVYKSANRVIDCSEPIRKLWNTIRTSTKDDSGKTWLSNEWSLCSPIKSAQDVEDVINWVYNILVNLAMVNYPYPTSFLAPLPAYPIRNFCGRIADLGYEDNSTLLKTVGEALQIYTNFTKETKCNNIHETAPDLGENAWDFQACTEIIMPMCSTDNDMFENAEWSFQKFAEDCEKKWGVKQTRANLPILEYGGKNIKAASNIVFSNGLLDPWSGGGVLSNLSDSVVAIIIPDGAHHLDLRESNFYDPRSVIEARKFHIEHIRRWLRNYYLEKSKNYYKNKLFYKKVQYMGTN